MTVMTTDNYSKFFGSGTAGPFTWAWRFLDNDDVRVYLVSGGVRTLLSEGDDYTLTGARSYAGGSLTLTFDLETGEELIAQRYTAAVQPVSIRNQGNNFRPEVHEDVFDKLTMILQDRASLTERSLLVPEDETAEIIDPVEYDNRPGKVLGWNSQGRLSLMPMEVFTSAGELSNPWADVRGYASLADAVAQLGGMVIDLIVPDNQAVTANLTIPENIRLVLLPGARITISAGVTLTLNRQPEIGRYPVFYGEGAVTGLKEARPEWWGVTATGVTKAVSSIASGGVLRLTGSYSGLSDKITIAGNNITIQGDGSTLTWSVLGNTMLGSLGAGTTGIEITGEHVTLRDLTLKGPHVGSYVGNACLITMVGTSTSSRKTGLTLDNVELSDVGAYGVFTQFVDDIKINNLYAHNIGYSGGTFLSPCRARVNDSYIKTITPGTGGNMYGLSFTHHSTGYSTDPNKGTPLAVHPFPEDVVVNGVTVEDVNWNGIDFHGGYNCSVVNSRVFATKHGIAIPTSSGDADTYAGWGNSVVNNIVDGRNQDGTTSGRENTGEGITVQGGTGTFHRDLRVGGNVVRYKGVVSNGNSGAILANYVDGGVISGNVIENWGGNGVLFNSAPQLVVANNVINGMVNAGDTIGRALCISTATAAELNVVGNRVSARNGAAAAREGFRFNAVTGRPNISGNDFSSATVNEIVPPSNGFLRGADYASVVSVSTTDATPSVANTSPVTGIAFAPPSPYTVTNVTNGKEGQIIVLTNTTSNTVTLQHNANITNSGGADLSLGLRDTVTYFRWGAKWLQYAPLQNNP